MKFEFQTNAEGNPVFKIKRSKSSSYSLNFLYVDVWHVSLDPSVDYPRAWALRQKHVKGELLVPATIVYGEIPEGFIQDIPPEPLLVGHYYKFGDTVFKKISETDFELYSWDEIEGIQMAALPDPHAQQVDVKTLEEIAPDLEALNGLLGDVPAGLKVVKAGSEDSNSLPSKETAHPNAVKLLIDDFYWDPTDDLAPFGTDDGWEVLDDYVKESKTSLNFDLRSFLEREFAEFHAGSLDDWSAATTHLNFDCEKGNTVIIAATFAQLMSEGRISKEMKGFWAQAFKLSNFIFADDEERLERLKRMQDVVAAAPR